MKLRGIFYFCCRGLSWQEAACAAFLPFLLVAQLRPCSFHEHMQSSWLCCDHEACVPTSVPWRLRRRLVR